ncbi:NADP oxidoreductase [bacterium]|nr:NADP oxidoreductase [bacterium]
MSTRKRFATIWLGGCTGCHMSFLDMDEKLLELPALADIVYSPLMDVKTFPREVDICLVEGAVNTESDLRMLRSVRESSVSLVSFGDCAVAGNITAMRNTGGKKAALQSGFGSMGEALAVGDDNPLPQLLAQASPLHQYVAVDYFLPGCPPSAELIWYVINELLHDRQPVLDREKLRYG